MKYDFYRSEDQVYLRFYFINLKHSSPEKRWLKKDKINQKSYLVVRFPQQHVAEQAFNPGEFARLRLSDVAVSRLSGFSWLAFEVDFEELGSVLLRFSFDALTNWSAAHFKLQLTDHAEFDTQNPTLTTYPIVEPYLLNGRPITLIEAPFRLYIAPHKDEDIVSKFPSSYAPASKYVEHWRANLVQRQSRNFEILVLATPDDYCQGNSDAPFLTGPPAGRILPAATDRKDLVRTNRKYLKPIKINGFSLGTNGINLDLDYLHNDNPPRGENLAGWKQLIALGRDQEVKIIRSGVINPFGLKAFFIQTTRRKYDFVEGKPVAYLEYLEYVVPKEFLIRYYDLQQKSLTASNRRKYGLPFKEVRIKNFKLLPLRMAATDVVLTTASNNRAFWPVNTDFGDVTWDFVGIDQHGMQSEFTSTFQFIAKEIIDTANASNDYFNIINNNFNDVRNEARRQVKLGSQMVSYALQSGQADINNALSQLETNFIELRSTLIANFMEFPVFPFMEKAKVAIPAITQMLQERVEVEIGYAEKYLQNFADPYLQNAASAFAEVKALQAELENKFEEKVKELGGLAKGLLPAELLSIHKDLVLMKKELDDLNRIDPHHFLNGLKAKILGEIELKEIIKAGLGIDRLPKIEFIQNKRFEYKWTTTDLKSHSFGTLLAFKGDRARLLLDLMLDPIKKQGHSRASLETFKVEILQIIVIDFTRLSFNKTLGHKEHLDVQIGGVEFKGELSFISAFAQQLGELTDNARIALTPTGIGFIYQFETPAISAGAFTFSNLRFVFDVALPFSDGKISTGIAINSEDDPFVVAVGIFGGGGSFAMRMVSKDIVETTINLVYGGYFGVSIGVARGFVYLFAGTYYSVKKESGVTKFQLRAYIICGGSMSILGFITVSLVFYLGMEYDSSDGYLYGRCVQTVKFKIAFVKRSYSVTYEKRLKRISGGQTQQFLLSADADTQRLGPKEQVLSVWKEYSQCFA